MVLKSTFQDARAQEKNPRLMYLKVHYGVPTEVGVFLPVGVLRHMCIFFGMKKLHNTPKITADLGVSPPRSVFFRRSVI
jgi:hypothetical protein